MKILALDTSTEACSAALHIDNDCAEIFEIAPRRHSELILVMVSKLLVEAGMRLTDLDALAFGRGPGSFTGLRIATGVVQGLAFGADLPVVPVSTLAAAAQGVIRDHGAEHVLVANDAGMNEVYWGGYVACQENGVALLGQERVGPPAGICLPRQNIWTGAGSGWRKYREILSNETLGSVTHCFDDYYPRARDVAALALPLLKQGKYVTAEQAIPVYLRDRVINIQ